MQPERFKLICEVGQGGMATVSLALMSGDAGFSKLVALKQPKASLASDEEFLEMFLDEARLAARLNHPHVVQTYEVGRHDGKPFIAMEFLEGQPLHRMQRVVSGGIPLAIHLRIIADALSGLHHAHELRDFSGAPLGVVHRDVSPQNLLVGYDGQTKVVDFGIAKAVTHGSHTELGLVKGKLPYMSPEQILGEPLDRGADIFAVGVMLWEAGARTRLWPNESARSRLRLLSLAEVPKLREIDEKLPQGLDRICTRALHYTRAQRYESAAALEVDVDRLITDMGEHATRREVAEFMHQHFESDRRRTRKLIEEQLGHVSLDSARKLQSASEAPRGTASSEAVQGTRRLAVLGALLQPAPAQMTDTPTTVAPATATVREPSSAGPSGRRGLAAFVLVLAAAAIVIVRLLGVSRGSTPIAQTPGPSSEGVTAALPMPASLPSATTSPAASPVQLASADPSKRGAPVPRASRATASNTSTSLVPAVVEPPAADVGDSQVDLSQLRKHTKKTARELDTADPWSH